MTTDAAPYAGLLVDAHLEARDAAGQTGKEPHRDLRLPRESYRSPGAGADRAAQTWRPAMRGKRWWPPRWMRFRSRRTNSMPMHQHLYGNPRAYWGLREARAPEDITHVEDLFVQIAVALDQKGLADAAAELRRLQSAINQAWRCMRRRRWLTSCSTIYNAGHAAYMQALGEQSRRAVQAGAGDAVAGHQDPDQRTWKTFENHPADAAAVQSRAGAADDGDAAESSGKSEDAEERAGRQQNKAPERPIKKMGE